MARQRSTWLLGQLVLLWVAAAGVFGVVQTAQATCPDGYSPEAGVCFPNDTGLSEESVFDIVTSFANWLLAIFGFIAILGFVISGIQYLTSAGDESQAETAKRNMKYSIIGVIVALSGWVVVQFVDSLLKASL